MRSVILRACLIAISAFAIACGDQTSTGDQTGGSSSGGNDGGGTVGDDTGISGDTNTSTADAGDETDAGASSGGTSSGGTSSGGDDGGSGGDDAEQDTVGGEECPGGFNCKCEQNDECDSGVCIDTADGKRCAKTCVDSCPDGFACTKFDPGTGDALFICTPKQLTLCSPCAVDADCQVYSQTSLCVDYGADGKFCGAECKEDTDCPNDYQCSTVDIGGGNTKQQCKLKDATAQCTCSQWAIDAGKGTTCETSNGFGTCGGKRSCGASGLSACDAPTPATEDCDNIDNDCNGTTDDINAANFGCVNKAWFDAGSKTSCTTDADCKEAGESCADDTKTCRTLIGACPGKATCEKGQITCAEAATPKQELCNGDDDDCDGKVDEDYAWTNPADKSEVPIGGKCGAGECEGGTVKCDTLSKAVCDTEATNKADKDKCDGKDNDCDGVVDNDACDDGDLCTTDTCNAVDAACETTAAVDCDDSNVCTTDSCDAKTGKCEHAFQDASCDDGNACTEGDKCVENAGKAECAPGKKKECDDANLCTDDSCDPKQGCVPLSNAATQACYSDSDPKTEGVGNCKGGIRFCKDGVLGKCEGEVLPAVKEKCDGLDDSCDGTTDEGCTGGTIEVGFATAGAIVEDKKHRMAFGISGDGTAGQTVGKKHEVDLGLLAWLKAWLGK